MIIYTDRHIISLTSGTCKQCGEELEAIEYIPAVGLQEVLDLLRTGTAPDSFGLTQEEWAIYKCNKAAWKLQRMIDPRMKE